MCSDYEKPSFNRQFNKKDYTDLKFFIVFMDSCLRRNDK